MVWARRAPAIAGIYWVVVLAAFFVMQKLGFDMTRGGSFPLIVLTMPWSIVALLTWQIVEAIPYGSALLGPLNSPLGTCVIFPVMCGGMNVVMILATGSAVHRYYRHNR